MLCDNSSVKASEISVMVLIQKCTMLALNTLQCVYPKLIWHFDSPFSSN